MNDQKVKETQSGVVSVIGRPNVGKSSLFNLILKEDLSIVTEKAQTTRDNLKGLYNTKRGQIIFLDTPGFHHAKEHGINAFMVQKASQAIQEEKPDLIWYLIEPSRRLERQAPILKVLEKNCKTPVFLILNKIDLVEKDENLRKNTEVFVSELKEKLTSMQVKFKEFSLSVNKKIGLQRILDATWNFIPPGPIYYMDQEQLSDQPVKFFVAEKIRKTLFLELSDEIPYSSLVQIENFHEKPTITVIDASIIVERPSQKGIVIGDKGKMIKLIGQSARRDIELFLNKKVFLNLNVRVIKNWTKDEQTLKRLGYSLN